MPKYDAFGREIGDDTLAGLGGGSEVKPSPEPVEATWLERTERDEATWQAAERVEVARLETAADAADEQADRAEDMRQEAASGSQWTAPVRPAARQPATISLPSPPLRPARRRGRKLATFIVLGVMLVVVLPLLLAGFAIVNTVGDATRELDDAFKIERPDSLPVAPTGLARGSLMRRGQLHHRHAPPAGPALRPPDLAARHPRADQRQFLTDDGRLRSAQLSSDGKLVSSTGGSRASARRHDPVLPREPGDAGAADARRRARRSGGAAQRAAVAGRGQRKVRWGVYFNRGRYVNGNANGRVWPPSPSPATRASRRGGPSGRPARACPAAPPRPRSAAASGPGARRRPGCRRLTADPGDVALERREQHRQGGHLPAREVGERGGVEDAQQRARRRRLDHAREHRQRVAAADVDRPVHSRDLDRRVEALVARGLVGPQAGAQPAHVVGVAQVDGGEVDARRATRPAAGRAAAPRRRAARTDPQRRVRIPRARFLRSHRRSGPTAR